MSQNIAEPVTARSLSSPPDARMHSHIRNSRIRLSQGQIFWREVGQGPKLVFLHGANSDGSEWLPVIEALQPRFHCFAPDLLGFGESEPPARQSIALQAECLRDYIEALRLERVYLVAHSIGAWVAATYALQHTAQVEGLILISPEGSDANDLRDRWQTERMLVARLPIAYWFFKLVLPVAGLFGQTERLRQLIAYRRELLRSPATCRLLFRRRQVEIQQECLGGKLGQLKMPVLVLQGGADSPAALAQSKAYAKYVPQARLRVMKRGARDLLAAWPESIVQEIQLFALAQAQSSPLP